MANKNVFTSAADAAAFLAEDETVKNRVESEICHSQLISSLMEIRLHKGISQKELSERIECTPSKISRLEAGNDWQLKLGDIYNYSSALGLELSILLEDKTLPVAERIKQHVFAIHNKLNELEELAKEFEGDDTIIKKIHEFYGEVLLNFLIKIDHSYKKLCSNTIGIKPIFKIQCQKDPVKNTETSDIDTQTQQECPT